MNGHNRETPSYRSLDFNFSMVADPPLDKWFLDAFGPFSQTDASGPELRVLLDDGRWTALYHGDAIFRGVSPRQVVHRLMVWLNHRIAASSGHLVLHGAVVAVPTATFMLCGPSGSGKSTLAAVAVQAGSLYGGDEHAALGLHDGLVHPVPKPIGLKYGSAPQFMAHADPIIAPEYFADILYVTAKELAGAVLVAPVAPTAIVLPQYARDAGVTIASLRPAEALMRLRSNAFNFHVAPQTGFRTLARLVRRTPILTLTYGDAQSAWEGLLRYAS